MSSSSSVTPTTAAPSSSSSWNGTNNNMSQEEFMIKDTVIVVNDDDHVIGSCSKQDSHIFSTKQPHGVLHRAFSVFLFDTSTNELLLQQRATSKVTFRGVWTNTCCSHPLHGMEPNEVDRYYDPSVTTTTKTASAATTSIQDQVMGVKYAAVRKLEQELGIPMGQIPVQELKFVTRLHYWAADTVTHGSQSPWGEHEIDYVLLSRVDKSQLTLQLNPDEVESIAWVSPHTLQTMLQDPQLLFSPWFRIICHRWLLPISSSSSGLDNGGNCVNSRSITTTTTTNGHGWWNNLDRCFTTDELCDFINIHTFDPPLEHLGGAGHAGRLFEESHPPRLSNPSTPTIRKNHDESKKQGAYGKIPIHKDPLWAQLCHVDEVMSAIWLLYVQPLQSNLSADYIQSTYARSGNHDKDSNDDDDDDDLAFCNDILQKVSRSFAAVIRQLPSTLLVDVMIFYLVLRALDTIEDDTNAFDSMETKVQHLLQFHQQALVDPHWSMTGVGHGDERRLLEEFPKAHHVFAKLPLTSRQIITDITQRMATGMAEFVAKDLGQGTIDVEQYNRYCHFVAGLVGEGLSRLFAASGLEHESLANQVHLSDQMGLFLQKTNIIRDYLEDYVDKRAFWPQSIWKKYSQSGDLGYFTYQDDKEVQHYSLQCLNELVTDALELVPDCLDYMSRLTCVEIFRFCAIPQVMAIATLDKVYNNPNVFTGVVKIRKGLSCQLILKTNNMTELRQTFCHFATSILQKAQALSTTNMDVATTVDPTLLLGRTIQACDTIRNLTTPSTTVLACRPKTQISSWSWLFAFAVPVATSGWMVWKRTENSPRNLGLGGAMQLLLPMLPVTCLLWYSKKTQSPHKH